jgi:hypothetical protein
LGYDPTRPTRKLRHLVTRSVHREALLSRLMRPSELAVAALSPLFYLLDRWDRPLDTRPPKPMRPD